MRWIVKTFKTLFILGVLAVPAGWGYVSWQKIKLELPELREKDQERYELMVKKFKAFSFREAAAIHEELKSKSKADFLLIRYNKLKKKWETDSKFRVEELKSRAEEIAKLKEIKQEEYASDSAKLGQLPLDEEGKALRIRWQMSPPWQKVLILREKCVKYMTLEKRSEGLRKNIHNLPRSAVLLGQSENRSYSIPELCEDLIPAGYDDRAVADGFKALKERMNYFYMVELLEEIGISKNEFYPMPARLRRMATDFVDY